MATLSSPDTSTTTPQTTSAASAANPPSHLAKLLSDALADAESLRDELSKQRKRADNAERLAAALQTVHGESNGTTISSPPPAQPQHPSSSSTTPPVNVEKITLLLTEFQARAERAERERDEEYARRSAISDAWRQLAEYLESVDLAVKDMRAGFHRIVVDGGGLLTPVTIPIPKPRNVRSYQPSSSTSFPGLPLPPAPSMRRQRTPSLESHGQPPSKRARQDYGEHPSYPPPQQSAYGSHPAPPVTLPQQQPRIIFSNHSQNSRPSSSQYQAPSAPQFAPQHGQSSRPSQHRRTSSGSSASASVDEMILEAADGSQSQPTNGYPQPESNARSRKRQGTSPDRDVTYESRHRISAQQQTPAPIPRNEYSNNVYRYQNGSLQQIVPASTVEIPGQREIQLHVFAPVVTGAPQKKSKFSGASIPSLSTASIGGTSMIMNAPPTAGLDSATSPPSGSYPPQNEQGQRICRQCGMPGRYKDGKCVEKWGPGPCGPGTVCDRCRKKMKRVERRGTMEQLQQQQLQQNSSTQRQAYGSQPLSFSPATPSQSQSSTALTRTDTLPANFEQSPQMSPPPPRIIQQPPTSHGNGRHASPAQYSPSSSSSARGVDAEIPTSAVRDGPPERDTARLSQHRPSSRQTSRSRNSRSPANGSHRESGTQSTDVEDADGEVEADAEMEGDDEVEVEAEVRGKKDAQQDDDDKASSSKSADGDGDAEADLLDAVDAAEGKSDAGA